MREKNQNSEHNIDEKLADFADQVITGMPGEIDMSSQDTEFQSLENTVLLLHRISADANEPPDEVKNRIRSRLFNEWTNVNQVHRQEWWQSVLQWLQSHQRQIAFAGSAFVFSFLLLSGLPGLGTSPLPGTALPPENTEPQSALPLGASLLISLFVAVAIGFVFRSKK